MDWGAAAAWLTGGLRAFVVLWSFALGAALGSFLNVVVYRLPAGLSLSRPKSRCPRCETPIRKGDNLPVLGWLRLRGRCRACDLPIAKRYPLVEAACGLLLATLAVQTVLLGGVNLPGADALPGDGRWVRDPNPEMIALCGYLFLGQLVLLAAGLIALDGHRLPVKLWVGGALLAIAASSVWPGVRLDPPLWNAEDIGQGGGRWTLAAAADPSIEIGGVPFAPDWRGPADAVLSGILLAGVTGIIGYLAGGVGRNGPADGWNLVFVAGVAGAWFGVRAGGSGLAAGGAFWLLSPIGYGFGWVRGRVPGATWAAFGTLAVPPLWFLLPRLTLPPGPVVTGLCCAWMMLTAGVLMDFLFFGSARSRSSSTGDVRQPGTRTKEI